jgi:hypothetical protein
MSTGRQDNRPMGTVSNGIFEVSVPVLSVDHDYALQHRFFARSEEDIGIIVNAGYALPSLGCYPKFFYEVVQVGVVEFVGCSSERHDINLAGR